MLQIDLAPKISNDREKVKRETDRPMKRQNKLITAHVKNPPKTKTKFKANLKKPRKTHECISYNNRFIEDLKNKIVH